MEISGAKIIMEVLHEQGTDTVFGYPGGAVLDIYNELYKNSDRIHHVLTAHEQGAAHAADGYARITGKVGVVIATSGPGATNLVTGIATAYLDSTPLVAITGNVSLPLIGRDSFQEVDIQGITMSITKHNYIVKDVKNLANIIREAFTIAKSGRPGPVLIDIPKDIQTAKCEYIPSLKSEREENPKIDYDKIEQVINLIQNSKRPYIYSGGGVVISEAGNDLAEFAENIDSPVGFSMMGLTAIPNSFRGYLGMTGMHGQYAASKAKNEADLIIAIGVRFSDRATGNKKEYAKNAKIIHIDIDPAEIDKNIFSYMSLVGDIKTILKILNEKIQRQSHPEWMSRIEKLKLEQENLSKPCNCLTPRTVIQKIQEYTEKDTAIVTDVGQHQMWTAQTYKFQTPRTFITSGGLGTMGFGLGAAIGSCIGKNKKQTILITGDGSFGMNLNELATAVSEDLPLVIVIMNNGVLGMVRQWQTMFYEANYSSTILGRKTDFVKLAEAFGAMGLRINSIDELEPVMKKAFSLRTTVVVDCRIDKDERVLPMIPPNGTINDIILK
ncbi:MAG: acetolactate synthase large subunit biosynthetic type [Clostridia bacterium]|nr:acetolactate synthase large subunit biosynthetic type [Clostridia bacterium]